MMGEMGLFQIGGLWHFDFTSLPQVCSIKINPTLGIQTMVMVLVDDSAETDGANESA